MKSKTEQRLNIFDISKGIDSSTTFTGKILEKLVKGNLITSTRGAHDNFDISEEKIQNTKLTKIVEVIDGNAIYNKYYLGLFDCNDSTPCPLNEKFKLVREGLKTLFETTTLEDLASQVENGNTFLKNINNLKTNIMIELKEQKIGQFVAQDFRTAAVFSEYGIDFCCKGNRPLTSVCEKNGINLDEILEKLNIAVNKKVNPYIDYKSWPLDLLTTYIEKTHHKYLKSKIPVLHQYLAKLCKSHGEHHPKLLEINTEFLKLSEELLQHMKKEEQILFPHIKRMVANMDNNTPLERGHFRTVKNPISMMEHEHDNVGKIFKTITQLTDNYTPPEHACIKYKVTYSMLDEFERDLHLHIHLENNILFPGAIKLEDQLTYDYKNFKNVLISDEFNR